MTSVRTWIFSALAAAGLLVLLPGASTLAAQEPGSITGIVTNLATGQPIVGAQLSVEGTNVGGLTGQDGRYTLRNVPAGNRQVRVTYLGFRPVSQEVDVQPGAAATADFQLSETAIGIEGITVTAFGEERRRREIGNVVGRISTDDVELAAINTFSTLIQGRSAGVTVRSSGGTLGTGARIRIRGANSVSLSNEPLIVIDGVRVNNSAQSMSVNLGGQAGSRMEDLNPDDIQDIEIIKGPSAAALYGTAAANGVIQITTRRGRAGTARWTAYVEQGSVWDPTTYPDNYTAWTTNAAGNAVPGCTLRAQGLGTCQADSLTVWNPIRESGLLQTGHQQRYGLSVQGGSGDFSYFLSGDFTDGEGVLAANTREGTNLRANFRTAVRDDLDVSLNTGYTTSTTHFPQNDNNALGLLSAGLLGAAFDNANRGFLTAPPDALMRNETGQQVDRLIGSMQADWRPRHWLTVSSTLGIDNVNRVDDGYLPPNTIFNSAINASGIRISNAIEQETYTWTLSGRAGYELSPRLTASTGLSGEFTREFFKGTFASGTGLLPGTRSLAGASENFSVDEQLQDIRTVGGAIEQRFAFDDRLFLNLAVRADDDNAFGDELDLIWYPSASASWVLDEEEWFPVNGALSTLRTRVAFGRAGLRPGFRDARIFFDPEAVNVDGQNEPGFSLGGAGNPELRPEISTEIEAGFDAGFARDRLGLELTFFRKTSRDALVARRLAPSLGATTTRFENLGEVRNQGVEASLNALLVNRPNFRWNATLSGSTLSNELIELGEGVEPIIFGLGTDTQRHDEGYPLGGHWGITLVDYEVGPDGVVDPVSIVLSDDYEFIGPSMPTRELSLNLGFDLFDFMRVSALFEHQGGHYQNNSTRFFRCGQLTNCREAFDPTADPRAQAESMAAQQDARGVFMEKADFTKFRELSVTLRAPAEMAQRLRTQGLQLTLSGRNLATWTDYTGFDPEVNSTGQANFASSDFLTQPPLRHFTARVSVNF